MADKMANGKSEEKRGAENGNGRRRRRKIIIPVVILIVVAAAVFFYWYEFIRGYVATDDAVIDSDAITISSKILGRITALNADEGDSIRAGEILVQLDDSDLKAQLEQAQANLDYMLQNVRVAKIALEQAVDDFYRDSIQFKNSVITRQQFDHSGKALEMAQAQQAVASSHVKTSQAQLAVIETQLQNTKIISSASGVIARKWVVPGDIVQPGQPIFTIFDLNDVWITANFEETKLSHIRPGDSVQISVDAIPDREFHGRVELIGAAAASQFSLIPPNNASGNFTKVTQRVPVRIAFTDLDTLDHGGNTLLLPGMSVEVKIKTMEK
jgi:membrane fusion protein (multidrug efflux system)